MISIKKTNSQSVRYEVSRAQAHLPRVRFHSIECAIEKVYTRVATRAIPPLVAARVRILLVVKSGHARNLWKR